MGLVSFVMATCTYKLQRIKCPIVWGWSLEPVDETGWPVLESGMPSSQPWNRPLVDRAYMALCTCLHV